MTTAAPDPVSDFNAKVEKFRANQGHFGGWLAGTPMILIHHIGARSGAERVTPLACNPQPDGRIAIVASNGRSPANPAWYDNLKAHPRITVEVGTHTFTALAQELDDAARAGLWASLAAESPDIGKHQAMTTRQIPVSMLKSRSLHQRYDRGVLPDHPPEHQDVAPLPRGRVARTRSRGPANRLPLLQRRPGADRPGHPPLQGAGNARPRSGRTGRRDRPRRPSCPYRPSP